MKTDCRVLPPGRYDNHIHVMPGKPDPERFAKILADAGITGGVLLSEAPNRIGTEAPEPAPPEEALANVFEWASGNPNLFPFYWIDPVAPGAERLVDLALEKGVYGFKVLPGFFMPGDPRALPVYRRIAAAGKPVLFHSGILWDGRPSSKYTRPGNYEELLAVPGLRFALAHVAWPWHDECIAVYGKILNSHHYFQGDALPEMFIDITPGTPPIYRKEVLTKLFTVGYDMKDHVLFGTDGITPIYGTRHSRDWQARDDAIYDELGLSEAARDSVYRGALQRFLFGGEPLTVFPSQIS